MTYFLHVKSSRVLLLLSFPTCNDLAIGYTSTCFSCVTLISGDLNLCSPSQKISSSVYAEANYRLPRLFQSRHSGGEKRSEGRRNTTPSAPLSLSSKTTIYYNWKHERIRFTLNLRANMTVLAPDEVRLVRTVDTTK